MYKDDTSRVTRVVGKCGDGVEFVKKMCGVFDVRWQFGDQWV